ncbi:MAG: hypothetical protein IPG89_05825 [Bacteroidetes bacterium]|nr:hypothetical protein [Bacteroidota bacterium]
MDDEQKQNNSEWTNITFRAKHSEKQQITELAESLDMNVSEFIRLKSLSEESTVVNKENRIAELEKEVRQLKVDLSFFRNSSRGKYDVVLKLNKEQLAVLRQAYLGDGWDDPSIDFAESILEILVEIIPDEGGAIGSTQIIPTDELEEITSLINNAFNIEEEEEKE